MSRDERPRLGVVCIVFIGGEIVLGRRARGGNVGKLVLPGGGIELGESWQEAGVREAREEIGLEVQIVDRLPVYIMEIKGDGSHRVCLVVRAQPAGPVAVLKSSDELSEVRAYAINDIPVAELSAPVRECLEALDIIPPYIPTDSNRRRA